MAVTKAACNTPSFVPAIWTALRLQESMTFPKVKRPYSKAEPLRQPAADQVAPEPKSLKPYVQNARDTIGTQLPRAEQSTVGGAEGNETEVKTSGAGAEEVDSGMQCRHFRRTVPTRSSSLSGRALASLLSAAPVVETIHRGAFTQPTVPSESEDCQLSFTARY